MLLLMRRIGEVVRINEKITIEIKEIQDESVVFAINGLTLEEKEKNKLGEKENN